MSSSWFRLSRPTPVGALIAQGRYDRAVEALRAALKQRPGSTQIRLQLVDALVKKGEKMEALATLMNIADEFARAGFAAKAVAILKRIQSLDPERADLAGRLAETIKAQDAAAAHPVPASSPVREPAPLPAHVDELDLDLDLDLVIEIDDPDLAAQITKSWAAPKPVVRTARERFFEGFDQDELVAVMDGCILLRHSAGDVVVTEGEPGDSLLVITSGTVAAWVRDSAGHNRPVRDMTSGDFFGEIAVLRGTPRTATVIARTDAELLVLDRPTLDAIAGKHPHVREVMRELADHRAASSAEATARGATPAPGPTHTS